MFIFPYNEAGGHEGEGVGQDPFGWEHIGITGESGARPMLAHTSE